MLGPWARSGARLPPCWSAGSCRSAPAGQLRDQGPVLRAAPRRLDRALGIEHDIKVYPNAGHAFLSQSEDEPGMVAGTLAQVTHAGYYEASARDARRRIIAFFDAHLKARRRSHAAAGTAGITRKIRKTG